MLALLRYAVTGKHHLSGSRCHPGAFGRAAQRRVFCGEFDTSTENAGRSFRRICFWCCRIHLPDYAAQPLANPNVIGITSGSSAAAVFCITLLHSNRAVVSVASVIAGLVTVIIIYVLSRGKTFSVGRLILVGIGIQAMLDALISYLLLVGAQQDIPAAIRWLSGSLNGSQMHELPPLVLTVLIFTPIAIVLGKHLSLLELGEQSATSLGVNTDKTRIALILSSVCMIALATATTGPIAFVSFLSGPIAKRLAGAGFSNIIPAGLVGVNLVLAADLIGQFAFEYRFPVGIMTGILGAPYLIFLLIRMNRKGEL